MDSEVSLFAREFVEVLPQVMRGVFSRQTDVLSKGKVTAPQYLVLDHIFNQGALPMSRIAKSLSVSLPAMSGLVDRLFKLRLVKRISEVNDRRVIRIELTARGRAVVDNLRKQRQAIFRDIFSRLSRKEREDFLNVIVRIKEILTRDPEARA